MRYMIIVKGDARTEAGEMPRPEDIAAMAEYHEQLAAAGVLVDANGLKSTGEGFRVQYRGEERLVIDGPFAETRDLIAGYTLIEVDSHAQALDWARRFPNPRGQGVDCEIEVRRLFELDDFEPSEGVERFRQLDCKPLSAPIPHLIVTDGKAAVDFYRRAFGARLLSEHLAEDGQRYMHAALEVGDGQLYLHDEFLEFCSEGGARSPTRLEAVSCTLHLNVDDPDLAWQRALEAGAEVAMPLDNQFWGMRYGQLRDPYGYLWAIGGPLAPG
jgi:uncharacterized glyoxalase superfamily protein PhnB